MYNISRQKEVIKIFIVDFIYLFSYLLYSCFIHF